jgi:hypothetical protein
MFRERIVLRPTPPRPRATELIDNGVSIEADAVLGLTARIRRFGGYVTDEAALAPEPFDARDHWSGSSRSIWSESLSAQGALVERSRREAVGCRSADDRRPEGSLKKSGRRCRIGAVVFVVGVRPPTRGGAKVKEPRS